MRRILGRANSSNVMKVIWLLEELHLPYTREDYGGPFQNTATPEYRALNPNGFVPTLVEDGFVLWESNAILRYLATGAPALWPTDPRARANIDRWMDWQQTTHNRPGSLVFQGLVRTPPAQRDPAAIATALAELAGVWSLLDQTLAAHPYVAGSAFTLADIPLGIHVHRWFAFPVDRPDLPHLRAWYDRLLARPAYAAHCAAPLS